LKGQKRSKGYVPNSKLSEVRKKGTESQQIYGINSLETPTYSRVYY